MPPTTSNMAALRSRHVTIGFPSVGNAWSFPPINRGYGKDSPENAPRL
jgi:hypothetical protein